MRRECCMPRKKSRVWIWHLPYMKKGRSLGTKEGKEVKL